MGSCSLGLLMLWGSAVAVAQPLSVSVQVVREPGGQQTVEVANDMAIPLRVRLSGVAGGMPAVVVVPAHEVLRRPIPAGAPALHWAVSPDAKYPSAPIYQLPFIGVAQVTQLPNCLASHEKALRHAVDFAMPEGTPVRAARDGTVLSMADGASSGGREPSHQVQILHSDGTWAVYGHLRANSILVTSGQFLQAGELLAYSGNSGISTGPHLHFAVHYLRNGISDTLPLTFSKTLFCGQVLSAELQRSERTHHVS